MEFTLAVVVVGVVLPLAAVVAAELQRRFGGRRAAGRLRAARDRAEASRLARARAARLRDEARGDLLLAEAQRLLEREQKAAVELDRVAVRAALTARPRRARPAAGRAGLTPMRAVVEGLRANLRALEAA